MKRLLALAAVVLAVLLGSCSLSAGSGFHQCDKDTECASDKMCLNNYCVPLEEGCGREAGVFDDEKRVLVAAPLPMTTTRPDGGLGPNERQRDGLNAMTLALNEINRGQGIDGRRLALVLCDTQGNDDRIARQTGWILNELRPTVLIAGGSAQTAAASIAGADAGVLVVSPSATAVSLDTRYQASGGLVWRIAPSDALQTKVLANLLLTEPRYALATRAGIIFTNDAYGQGFANELREVVARDGGRIVQTVGFDKPEDIQSKVANLATAFDPDVTVVVARAEQARVVVQAGYDANLRADGGHQWVFTDAAKGTELLRVSNAETELVGSYGTGPAQGAGSAYSSFDSAYRSAYGKDPALSSFTAHSYDAMYLIGLGVAYATAAGRTLNGHTVAEGLSRISSGTPAVLRVDTFPTLAGSLARGESINVEGASGPLDYLPGHQGSPYGQIEVWRVEDAGFTTLRNVDPM